MRLATPKGSLCDSLSRVVELSALVRDMQMQITNHRSLGESLKRIGPSSRGNIMPPVRYVEPQSSSLEILLGAQKLHILGHVEKELDDFCSTRKSPEARNQCQEVVSYYKDKLSQAQSGCVRELESEKRGSACDDLDNLERLVYEVAYSGGAETLYRVLRAEQQAAKRKADPHAAPRPTQTDRLDALHSKAMTLFEIVDANHNGAIDREELLNAMAILECKLSEDELGLVLSCMDCHGHITKDQFADIVQAEELRTPDSDAEVLRHLKHSRPSWWSECPMSIELA